jgi:hypothetical protein
MICTLDAPYSDVMMLNQVIPKLGFSERLSPVVTLHGAYARWWWNGLGDEIRL